MSVEQNENCFNAKPKERETKRHLLFFIIFLSRNLRQFREQITNNNRTKGDYLDACEAFITSKRQNVIHNSPLRTVLGTTYRFQVCSPVIRCLICGKDNVKVSEYLHIVSYESRPPFSCDIKMAVFFAVYKNG